MTAHPEEQTALRPYEYYVDMVENKYFGKVDQKDLAATLDCFTEDAVFTIQSAFTTHEGRDTSIKGMFERLFDHYVVIVHKDFWHVVDEGHQCCASRFNVELEDKNGKRTSLSNCNFFYLENGKFKRVYVYMSGENVLK